MDHTPPRLKSLPAGISDFKELIERDFAYVDKSLFIKELIDVNDKVALIPRMRRFGKTLNLSMLRYFFELAEPSNAHLFEGLAISQHPDAMQHQGKYPVIYLTLKDVKEASWEVAYDALRLLIAAEFRRHRYLLDSTVLDADEKQQYQQVLSQTASQALYEASLKYLTQWLTRHHNRPPVVLIDEYDTPVHEAYLKEYYTPMVEFMRVWLGGALKDGSIQWSVITGILRVAKASIFSGLNNDTPYTVLQPHFSSCFGLLEHEVKALLDTYGLAHKHDEMRRWYDGYTIGNQTAIYNPWSVIQCIRANGVTSAYWAATGNPDLIQRLVVKGPEGVRKGLEVLLQGDALKVTIPEGLVFPTLEQEPEAIWALLLYAGYLTPVTIPEAPNLPCTLRIPNEEVRQIYASIIRQWFALTITSDRYHELLKSLITGDIETFSLIFQRLLLSSLGSYDVAPKEPEVVYHMFVLGLVQGLATHTVRSNRESGYGRYDVMLIPKDRGALGVVMEFKTIDPLMSLTLEQGADAALKQIEEKRYVYELHDQGVARILCLGLAFQGKSVLIKHRFL